MNIENNKIIAEFTGYILRGKNTYEYNNKLYLTEELLYYSDWNWLMEVVEKIESLGFETSLDKNGFFIRINGSNTQSGLFVKNKIESVYNACIEFITWYNQQEK